MIFVGGGASGSGEVVVTNDCGVTSVDLAWWSQMIMV